MNISPTLLPHHLFRMVSHWILLSVLLIFSSEAQAQSAAASALKVGVIVVQSGPVMWWGRHLVQGVRLAAEEQGEGRKVEFFYEDDGFSGKNALTAANMLLAQKRVDALVTFGGGSASTLGEFAEGRKVPMIGIAGVEKFAENRSFVYRVFIGNEASMRLLTKEAEKKSLGRMAVVASEQETMIEYQRIFSAQNEGKIVFNERIQPVDTDVLGVSLKIRAKKPDGVVFFLNPPHLSQMAKILRNQGVQGSFLGGVSVFNPGEIKASQGGLIGALFPSPDITLGGEFAARYREKFGEEAVAESIYGYDVARMLIAAARSEGGDAQKFLSGAKSFQGVCGEYPRKGQSFEVPVVLREVDGEFTAKVRR